MMSQPADLLNAPERSPESAPREWVTSRVTPVTPVRRRGATGRPWPG
jgi:hypothetical protein